MTNPLLSLRSFSMRHNNIEYFDKIDIDLWAGEVCSLQGDNGAGKTTLLLHLAGMPVSWARPVGSAAVLGRSLCCRPVWFCRNGVFLLRQKPTSYKNLMVLEQLEIAAMSPSTLLSTLCSRSVRACRGKIRSVAINALNEFGIQDQAEEPVSSLSIGQVRRLGLAAARMRLEFGKLRLLLLDEPKSGLDPEGQQRLNAFLDETLAMGCGILAAEHVSEQDKSLGSRTIYLHGSGSL